MSEKQYIDFEVGLSRVRGNKPLYHRLLGMFSQSDEFQNLEDAIALQDTAAAAHCVHSIKGMSGNLALEAVFDLTSRLMVQYRENRVDPALLEQYRQALEETLCRIDRLLSSLTAPV